MASIKKMVQEAVRELILIAEIQAAVARSAAPSAEKADMNAMLRYQES